MLDKFMRWFVQPVGDAPEEVAVCEFGCDRTECAQGEWASCERRLGAHCAQHQDEDITGQ